MKDDIHEQTHFVKYLLTFVFVFIILVATVFSIHYSGILSFESVGKTAETSDDIETLPSDTAESAESTSASETETTETTDSDTEEDQTPTESTERSTKYPPATVLYSLLRKKRPRCLPRPRAHTERIR